MKRTTFLLTLVLACLLFGSSESKAAEKAFLGVVPDKDIRVAADDFEGYGLRISRVVDEGPAEEAGMRGGDVLIFFNGKPVQDGDDLSFFLRKVSPGDKVKLKWVRKGQIETGIVELDAKDESNSKIALLPGNLIDTYNNKAFLGVSTVAINENLLEYFGVAQHHGILIDGVVTGSAAESAGLKVGDVLVEINGHGVDSPGRLRRLMQKHDPGERVTLTVVRDRVQFELQVTLGDRDMSDASPSHLRPSKRSFPAMPAMPEVPAPMEGLDKDVWSMPGMRGVEKSFHLLREMFVEDYASARP